jgi:hypothetical protein
MLFRCATFYFSLLRLLTYVPVTATRYVSSWCGKSLLRWYSRGWPNSNVISLLYFSRENAKNVTYWQSFTNSILAIPSTYHYTHKSLIITRNSVMGIGDESPWRRKETRTKTSSIWTFIFVRTKLKVCPYSFQNMSIRYFFKSLQHDKEVVDVSSLCWSEYFLIMRLHVPYVVFTLYSSIYMTMTTRCRN